jgi:hypothetical protein
LQYRAYAAEQDDIHQSWPADQQSQSIGHRSEIRADIDRICQKEQRDDALEQPVGIVLTKIASEPFAGNSSYSRADLLNRNHQRVGEEHGPRNREAELGTGLAIGAYAARVIVGCSGDDPGSDQA